MFHFLPVIQVGVISLSREPRETKTKKKHDSVYTQSNVRNNVICGRKIMELINLRNNHSPNEKKKEKQIERHSNWTHWFVFQYQQPFILISQFELEPCIPLHTHRNSSLRCGLFVATNFVRQQTQQRIGTGNQQSNGKWKRARKRKMKKKCEKRGV